MPRTARIFQRAVCYHLMNRGLNRSGILTDEADKKWFSDAVADYKGLCGARVYHWAWMDTHYHMLVEVVFANLRAFAGGIQQVYAQALTRTDDDEWMGKQMLRSAIGTENFMRQLKMEGGRHRRKRGKPAKVCEY